MVYLDCVCVSVYKIFGDRSISVSIVVSGQYVKNDKKGQYRIGQISREGKANRNIIY